MNEYEQGGESLEQEIERLALRAVEIPEIQEAVRSANSKLEAIRSVRALLVEHLPVISSLPNPEPVKEDSGVMRLKNPLGGTASSEFLIAHHVVDLLFER